jgi:hypothetical protein
MISRSKHITSRWLVILLTIILGAAQGQRMRPIAMDKIESGDLYVLGLSGHLYRLRTQIGGMSLITQVDLPGAVYPVDLTSAKLNNQAALFVSYNNEQFGAVSRYSIDGKIEHTWFLRSGVAGVDIDYVTQTLYVASSDSGEISSINLKNNDAPKYIASILDARKLGPLVLHVPKRLLFAADIETGNIYEANLATKKTRLFAPRMGLPQAMLVLEDQNILLVADSAGRRIYSIRLNEPTTHATVWAALPDFRSPSGLARLATDQIAVSDDSTGKLFALSMDGRLLYSYPTH